MELTSFFYIERKRTLWPCGSFDVTSGILNVAIICTTGNIHKWFT